MLETTSSAQLTPSDVLRFARLGRGETVETQGSPDQAQLARAMAAMANSRGGVILVGVGEGGEISGVDDRAGAAGAITAAVSATRPPLTEKVRFYPVMVEERVVVVVEVAEDDEGVYSSGGSFPRR